MMDYIHEEMERQRLALELLMMPAGRNAAKEEAAAVGEILAAAAAQVWDTAANVPGYGGMNWNPEERPAAYRSRDDAGRLAKLRRERAGLKGGAWGRSKSAEDQNGIVEAAVRHTWTVLRGEEISEQLAVQRMSRVVERDARRYDGGYQMY